MIKKLNKVDLMELNESYQKFLFWFMSFPDKSFSLNNISKELKISKTSANQIVNMLVKKRLLKIEVVGKTWRIFLNKSYASNYSIKIGYNLMMIYRMLYNSNIIAEVGKKVPNYLSLILFGSYRKGDDNENSDIDIAVEVGGDKEVEICELGVIPKFGYRKNIKLNLFIFSRKKVDLNLFSNIANGIVLEGFLEVKP